MTIPRKAMVTTALCAAALVGSAGAVPASVASPRYSSADLSRYLGQRLDWGACPSDDTKLTEAGAQCAQLAVPLDYADPGGRSSKLAISRIKAKDRAHRRGILLSNPGGPGGSGLEYTAHLRPAMEDTADRYDLIGFDPRFVGRSTPIYCGTFPLSMQPTYSRREAFEASVRNARETARRCFEHGDNTALLPHASSRNVARDMDLIRAVLGERRLSYYGISYGADLGAAYTQMFPARADRIVIDSVTDPRKTQYELFQSSGEAQERNLDEWAAWTAQRSEQYRLGSTPHQVRTAVESLVSRVDGGPLAIGKYTVNATVLELILGQQVGREENNAAFAGIVRNLVDAAEGRPVQPVPELRMWLDLLSQDELDGPVFGAVANGIFPCPFWRTEPREPGVKLGNRVPLLLLQATRDNAPYSGALVMHRKLRGSRLVSADIRTHGVYGRAVDGLTPIACADRAVNAYLRTGTLPATDITCANPGESR